MRLLATAGDLEHGPLEPGPVNTRWLLDGEIVLGNGNDLEIAEIALNTPRGPVSTPLPVGAHRLRVEFTIPAGATVNDEIPIEIAADSDRDGIPDAVEIERGSDPLDPGNRGNVAPVYPFAQWRFGRRERTALHLSHLAAGESVLELGFIDEARQPLAGHPLRLVENGSAQTLTTDAAGWVRLRLESFQTVVLLLSATANRPKGFISHNSPVTALAIRLAK